jgi:hypothetical protein
MYKHWLRQQQKRSHVIPGSMQLWLIVAQLVQQDNASM